MSSQWWEPIPYFTEFADLSDARDEGTFAWARFHIGFRLAYCAIPLIVVGENVERFGHWLQNRLMDWAERP